VGARARACFRACKVTYPVCHVQAPYCLLPLWLHHIFRHYLMNGRIFGGGGGEKATENKNCVLIFFTTFT
jgi:hypothetical protein